MVVLKRNADDRLRRLEREGNWLPLAVERNRLGRCAVCDNALASGHPSSSYTEVHKDAHIKICLRPDCRGVRLAELLQEGAIAYGEADWQALYGEGLKAPKGMSRRKGAEVLQDGLVLAYASLSGRSIETSSMRMYQHLHGEINLPALAEHLDADIELATELAIYSDNTRGFFDGDRKIQAGALRVLRGQKPGKLYDRVKLHKAYYLFVNELSKAYSKEFADGSMLGDAGDRKFAAWTFVADFETHCRNDDIYGR